MDTEKKREIIMKHYSNPKNRKLPEEEGYEKVNTANSSCVDNLDIYVKIENNKIKDITFMGEACAISISSTSIMINNLIGKSIDAPFLKKISIIENIKVFIRNLLKKYM